MHATRRTSIALAGAAALALAVGAPSAASAAHVKPTKPAPRVGAWKGTVTAKDGGTTELSFRVVKKKGRYLLRTLNITYTEVCLAVPAETSPSGVADPGGPQENEYDDTNVKVRTTGRFSGGAQPDYSGRFTSSKRATGKLGAFEEDPRPCSFAGATFTAKYVGKGSK